MSGPQNAITPVGFVQPPAASFTAGNTTIAKVLVDQYPAAASAGNLPAYYGGCSVIDLVASSSDTVARDVLLYIGYVATTQATTGTNPSGAITTTASTLVRATGSWIVDGYQVGDQIMTFAPPGTAPNNNMDGIPGTVTSISALTMTVNATPFGTLTLAAGTRIVRNSPHLRVTVPIAAGTNGTTSSVGLIGTAVDGSALKYEIKLGPQNVLIVGMQATVSALPVVVSVGATVALY